MLEDTCRFLYSSSIIEISTYFNQSFECKWLILSNAYYEQVKDEQYC